MKILNEIAKSIYNKIQSMIEDGYCPDFLNFLFNYDGEFVEYTFTNDMFCTNGDEGVWGGIERKDYVNMSIEDIEEELKFVLKN